MDQKEKEKGIKRVVKYHVYFILFFIFMKILYDLIHSKNVQGTSNNINERVSSNQIWSILDLRENLANL